MNYSLWSLTNFVVGKQSVSKTSYRLAKYLYQQLGAAYISLEYHDILGHILFPTKR